MNRHILALLLLLLSPLVQAAEKSVYTFGVVPQQSATRLALQWVPLLKMLSQRSGVPLRFATAPSIDRFEQELSQGHYDFAYMNPYHYTVFAQRPGYRAMAHAAKRKLQGVIVVRADSPIRSLEALAGQQLAFPSPGALAASILTRAGLRQQGIKFEPVYVNSHDSVYQNLLAGVFVAGGGIKRTLNSLPPEQRQQLRILWQTPKYTPHAIAAHPALPEERVQRLTRALAQLADTAAGRELLKPLKISAWQPANDSDWDDIRALQLHELDRYLPEAAR